MKKFKKLIYIFITIIEAAKRVGGSATLVLQRESPNILY